MPGDVVGKEGRYEVVTVVVACLQAQGARYGALAGFFEELGFELISKETVGAPWSTRIASARAPSSMSAVAS